MPTYSADGPWTATPPASDGVPPSVVVGPLTGVRVLELGSFIAGPFAGQLLGDYGADVIKVEPIGIGDPMRRWGHIKDGQSLWWPTIARNKRSVSIDLRRPVGRDLIRRMVAECSIVVENFRPGRLADWELDFDHLVQLNPALVMVHVSGYGQTGPRAREAGFGSIGEAMGGIRYTTGSPDRPPSRSGISLGDALAALFGVIGALAALTRARATGEGQEVDVAIYEAVAAMMESTMADYELAGLVRHRSGAELPGVAPSNVYPTKDSEVVIAGNADTVFRRLCEAMGQPELATDDRFANHESRGRNSAELDTLIMEWSRTHDTVDLLRTLELNGVPSGQIYTAADMVNDPHYLAREMVLRVPIGDASLPMTGVVPKFSVSPGGVRSVGPALGSDTRAVLHGVAGLSEAEIDELVRAGVVYCG